jgi:hypothetical protein
MPKRWPQRLQRSDSRKLSNPQLGHFKGGFSSSGRRAPPGRHLNKSVPAGESAFE